MKKIVFIIVTLLSFSIISNAQQKLVINLCSNMDDFNNTIKMFSIIEKNGDTLVFPYIDNNVFLNPFNLCGNPENYKHTDTTTVLALLQNDKFIYQIRLRMCDLFCPKLDFCVGKRIKSGYFYWTYTNCASVGFSSSSKRIRKSR